jgi:peptidyl-prolyl cis-trans isomerase NIMA-interacting 1
MRSSSVLVVLAGFAIAAGGCDDKSGKAGTAPQPSASASASADPGTSPSPSTSTSASAPAAASASAPFVVPDAVIAQHVLVAFKGAEKAPKGITRSKADAKKRAEEVATKAKGGADFSALVAEYSDDPAAGERRGSVGKFTRDKMAKPFSDAAFALRVDEISAPVETPFGYHVIKRNQ